MKPTTDGINKIENPKVKIETIILLIIGAFVSLWIFSGFALILWGLVKGLFNLPRTIKEVRRKKRQEKEIEESYRKAELRRREEEIRIGALYLRQEKDEILFGKYASPTILARAIWEITEINSEGIWVKDVFGRYANCVSKQEIINDYYNVDNIFKSDPLYGNKLLEDYKRSIELLQERLILIKERIEITKGKE